ncbi:MAG: hypothetical protein DWP97_01480 [Calditrichaeota bacterium]|nr:MAG: hypothetical protein DWP97_01480 [Calditrichota bacterium]
MLRHPFLSPFLFALFPILFIYSQNAYEAELREIYIPALIVLAVTFCLLLVLRVFKVQKREASLLTASIIFFFFLFGNILALLPESIKLFDGFTLKNSSVTLFVISVCLLTVFYLIFKFKPSEKLITIINIIGIVLVVMQILQGGYVLATRDYTGELEEQAEKVEILKTIEGDFPDIYFFVLDGYARADVLRDYYQYDNSEFLSFLRDNNFYLADSSTSNYAQTLLSVAATLNLNYIPEIGDFYHLSHDRMPLAKKLWDNKFFTMLKERGYEIISYATGLNYTEFVDADKFLSPNISLSQYQNILLSYTPIPYLFDLEKSQYDLHRDRILYAFDNLADAASDKKPSFVFIHVIAPHPPFVFDAQGRPIEADRTYSITDGTGFMQHGGSVDEYIQQYRDQLAYISKLTQKAINDIFESYDDNKPIIVIQGDHGPGSQTHWNLVEQTDMHERFSILNAVYTPDNKSGKFYHSMTPINTFRIISNKFLKTEFPLLFDSSYFSTFSYPYSFYNVTEKLNSSKK